MTIIEKLLNSTRVQAVLMVVAIAFFQKNFPQFSPDDDTVKYIIAANIALIAGDTFRPVDPAKGKP